MYNKEYYIKNKEKFLNWQRKYRKEHKDKVDANRKKYEARQEIKQKRKEYKKQYRLQNKERLSEQNKRYLKKWYAKNREKLLPIKRKQTKIYYQKNRDKIREYEKQHSQIPEVKARRRLMERLRNRKNPRSNRGLSLDLQLSMNNVRLRDKNTCQWQGCHLTFREAPIHVHHIFPRSEYPELQYEEQYMICYCANHHVIFHRFRGDSYSEMIGQRSYEDPIQGRINV